MKILSKSYFKMSISRQIWLQFFAKPWFSYVFERPVKSKYTEKCLKFSSKNFKHFMNNCPNNANNGVLKTFSRFAQ